MDLPTLLRLFEKTGIPQRFTEKGAYAIFGSAPMSLKGLKEPNDLDILVSPEVWQFLIDNGHKPQGDKIVPLNTDIVEIFKTWTNEIDPAAVLRNAEKAHGCWFASLEDVLNWKRRRGKPKDLVDVKTIEEYMAQKKGVKMSALTDRLDKVANEIETVNPGIALAIDRISDKLARKEAGTLVSEKPYVIEQLEKSGFEIKPHHKQHPTEELFEIYGPSKKEFSVKGLGTEVTAKNLILRVPKAELEKERTEEGRRTYILELPQGVSQHAKMVEEGLIGEIIFEASGEQALISVLKKMISKQASTTPPKERIEAVRDIPEYGVKKGDQAKKRNGLTVFLNNGKAIEYRDSEHLYNYWDLINKKYIMMMGDNYIARGDKRKDPEAPSYIENIHEGMAASFTDLSEVMKEAKWVADYLGGDVKVVEIETKEGLKIRYMGPGPGTSYHDSYPVSHKVIEVVKTSGKPYEHSTINRPKQKSQIEKFREKYKREAASQKSCVGIADHLRYVHEAGIKDWLKKLVSKIPGLPTKEQALKTVGEFLKKSPKDFEKGVDEIINVMKSIPMTGLTAFDIKGLTRNLKIITNPQVVLAIIALMAMFQTADAGVLRDKIRGR